MNLVIFPYVIPMNYYDIVLTLVPTIMVGLTGALVVAGVSVEAALFAASILSAGVIGHAMFVRTPVPSEEPSGPHHLPS